MDILMTSNTRLECTAAVVEFMSRLDTKGKKGDLLYVGTAGDPNGCEYRYAFSNYQVTTMDIDSKWNPDIVGDISVPGNMKDMWDVVVCVQVLEHVEKIWDVPKTIKQWLKPKGYAIVDCPWDYPYHAEPPSFKDYWRISKDGMLALFKADLEVLDIKAGLNNTSVLLQNI